MPKILPKIRELQKENDELKVRLALLEKQATINGLIKDVPKEIRTEYFIDSLVRADDEEEMKRIVDNQLAASGKGKVINSGEEFGPEEGPSEGNKKAVLKSIKGGKK